MPTGRYEAGERAVIVTESDARLSDGTLAGSVAPIDQALRNLITYTQCTLPEALATVTTTPASLLGIADQRGRLAPGLVADMVLLSPDLEVQVTISKGKVVYQKEEVST
jgi:N-acetylglucosamine-6-phosphate deacetylase